ncbi:RecBCD enzyme subunit RecC [Buchnera aphidicola (Thelaxes suberi)]|uniref:exodeoxyribonuclease V subunit gamma n=1 Tax=Buchnera aphidicola TaxID=9 RepID=UPI003464A6AF
MLKIYEFNQLEQLFETNCKIIKKKNNDFFEPEIFLINKNIFLSQWLKINFAKKNSICANYYIQNIEKFFYKFLKKILPKNHFYFQLYSSCLIWKIMQINDLDCFPQSLRNNNTALKKYEIAVSMSVLLKKYFLHHSNWNTEWFLEKKLHFLNNQYTWQKKIWNKIIFNNLNIKKINNKNYNILKFIFKKIRYLFKTNKKIIPKRIFIYDICCLSPFYINIIKILSLYSKIFIFYVNIHIYNLIYKKNLIPIKNIAHNNKKKKIKSNDWNNYFFYFEKIINNNIQKKYFKLTTFKNNNLLNFLKNEILKNDIFYHTKKEKKFDFIYNDQSVSIHSCINIRKEVEVVFKEILYKIKKNNKLNPQDILIFVKNIDEYKPYITSIFNSYDKKKYIPFIIITKKQKINDSIIKFFKKILLLNNSRITLKEIFEMIQFKFIHTKFSLKTEEIMLFKKWSKKINIKWGYDKNHFIDLKMEKCNVENTWKHGIKRMLLGTSVHKTSKPWKNILPSIYHTYDFMHIISVFTEFICLVNQWRKKLLTSKPLKSWNKICDLIIDQFFNTNDYDINQIINNIKIKWKKIFPEIIQKEYKKKISIKIIYAEFKRQFKNRLPKKNLFSNSIIFSDFNYFENIPFKMIGILGYNSDILHPIIQNKLDLTQYNLNISDICSNNKEKKRFLNIITASKDFLYLSFINSNVHDVSMSTASPLIMHIIDYLSNNINFPQQTKIKKNKETIKQFIIKKLCTFHNNDVLITDYINDYMLIRKNIEKIENNIKTICNNDNKIFNNNSINILTLINFWKNPIKFYFNKIINVNFNSYATNIIESEPFTIDHLNKYKINKKIFSFILKKKNTKELLIFYKRTGIIPHGHLGNILFNQQIKIVQQLVQNFLNIDNVVIKKTVNFNINNINVFGKYYLGTNTGIIMWKPSLLRYVDQISLWIYHIIYCYLGGRNNSFIIGTQNSFYGFYNISYNQAKKYLIEYIQGYYEGLNDPVYLIQSGYEWITNCFDKSSLTISNKKINVAFKKCLQTWNGNNFIKGEKKDNYINKIILDLNQKNRDKIYMTTEKWILPILKNKIWKLPIKKINNKS